MWHSWLNLTVCIYFLSNILHLSSSSSRYLAIITPCTFCIYKINLCAVLSRVQLFATPWTVARQAPLFVGFFRQEYWSGLPFPPPGDLHDPGIEPTSPLSPALQADSLPAESSGNPFKKQMNWYLKRNLVSTVSYYFFQENRLRPRK